MATPYPSPLPTPAWIQANEAVVGENSPLALADVANRPAKTIMTSLQQVATFIEQGGANQYTSLGSLQDVLITVPASGDYLKWNGSKWINAAIAATTTALSALTDTGISGPATGDILMYNGSVWINTKTITGTIVINAGAVTNALIVTTTGAIQFSARYDSSNRLDVIVDPTGVITFTAVGSGPSFGFNKPVSISSTVSGQFSVLYNGSNYFALNISSAGLSTFTMTGASPGFKFSNPFTIQSVAIPQFYVSYDGSNYLSIGASSAGVVTLTATGSGASIYLASPTTITSTLGIQNTVTITQGTVNTLGLTITGSSTTGSSAVGLVSISHTWNTSGIPTLIDVNVTNIASGSGSKIINLRFGSNSVFLVGTLGVVQLGRADSSTAYVGMTISSSGLFTITPNGTTAYGFLSGPGWTVGSTLDIVGGVLIMAASAIIKIGNSGSASNPAITTLNRESTGIFIDFSSPNALGISYLGTEFARFYGTTTDDMGIMLQDITGASLKQVKRGAADSGGSGYRLLKVAN